MLLETCLVVWVLQWLNKRVSNRHKPVLWSLLSSNKLNVSESCYWFEALLFETQHLMKFYLLQNKFSLECVTVGCLHSCPCWFLNPVRRLSFVLENSGHVCNLNCGCPSRPLGCSGEPCVEIYWDGQSVVLGSNAVDCSHEEHSLRK